MAANTRKRRADAKTGRALQIGRAEAERILEIRRKALRRRARAPTRGTQPLAMTIAARLVLFALVGGFAAGCSNVHLYRADDDQQVQAAKTSYSEAQLQKSIDAERQANAAISDRERATVALDQRSLRDRVLVRLLFNATKAGTWGRFGPEIDSRLADLIGSSKGDGDRANVDLAHRLDSHLEGLTRFQLKLEPARQNYRLASGGKVLPACPIQDSQRPQNEPALAASFATFEDICKTITAYQAKQRELIDPQSLLGRKDAQLVTIAGELAVLQGHLAEAANEYAEALAATKQTRDPGKLEILVATLKQKLDALESLFQQHVTDVATKTSKLPLLGHLKSDPILSKLLAQGARDRALKQKQLLDEVLEAAQGRTKPDARPELQLVARVSELEKAITSDPYEQIGAFVLQAEFLRLKAAAIDRQIARAYERIDLLKKQRSSVVDEILLLADAQRRLRSYMNASCPQDGALFDDYRGAPKTCKATLAGALASLSMAWTLGREKYEQLEYELIGQGYVAALDDSEIAINQADVLMRIPIEQLAKAYASGIRAEDVSNLVQALGLSAIAVRLK